MNAKKTLFLVFFSLLLLNGFAEETFGRSFFTQRSQGSNTARELVGWAHKVNLTDMCNMYGTLSITPGYQSSFDREEIGKYIFYNGTNTMQFAPITTPGMVAADVSPINFLLNTKNPADPDDIVTFDGTVRAFPQVSTAFIDFNFYLGLDAITPGLYARIHTPFCHTRWKVDLSEEIINSTGATIPANLLGNPVATPAPTNSIIEAWKGQDTFADVKAPMSFARIDGTQKQTGLADVELAIGYNWVRRDDAHFGLNARVIFPATNSRAKGEYVFEPLCGNGHHTELGFGITGHLDLWRCGCEQSLGIYIDGNLYHMFKTTHKRTFDLTKNGIGSRYLLFKRFNGTTNTYLNEIVRGPNILTLSSEVKIDIHADISIMLDYRYCNFTFDLGYNLWGISGEKITIKDTIPERTFAVAGNSGTGLNANRTASCTTITGENANTLDGASSDENVYLLVDDLNVESAQHPSAVSHKLFAHLAYTWDYCYIDPYFGGGFEAEFSGRDNRALDQWAVWIKGGFSFAS